MGPDMGTDLGSILSSATCLVHSDKSKSILEVEKPSIISKKFNLNKETIGLVDWLNMGITEQYFK